MHQLIIPGFDIFFPELLIPEDVPKKMRKPFKTFSECFNYFKSRVIKKKTGCYSHGSRILSKLEAEGICRKDGITFDFADNEVKRLFNRYYADEIILEMNA